MWYKSWTGPLICPWWTLHKSKPSSEWSPGPLQEKAYSNSLTFKSSNKRAEVKKNKKQNNPVHITEIWSQALLSPSTRTCYHWTVLTTHWDGWDDYHCRTQIPAAPSALDMWAVLSVQAESLGSVAWMDIPSKYCVQSLVPQCDGVCRLRRREANGCEGGTLKTRVIALKTRQRGIPILLYLPVFPSRSTSVRQVAFTENKTVPHPNLSCLDFQNGISQQDYAVIANSPN